MPETTVQERLLALEPSYREFVTSDFARTAAAQFGVAEDFSDDQILILQNGIMLYLLLFFDLEGLATFIATECDLSADQANVLAAGITATLPDGFPAIHDETVARLEAHAGNSRQGDAADLQSEIAATEAALAAHKNHTEASTTHANRPSPENPPTGEAANTARLSPTVPEEPTHFSNQADLLDFDPQASAQRPPHQS